jgi:hypothetical protein
MESMYLHSEDEARGPMAHLAHDGRGAGAEDHLEVLDVLRSHLQLHGPRRFPIDAQPRPPDSQVVLRQLPFLRPAATRAPEQNTFVIFCIIY